MDSTDSTPDKHKKTAKQQFEIYLDFVKQHSLLKKGWNVQKMHMAELNDIWREMAKKLNNCSGPCREMSHWKKVFTEWKSHTRRKLKYGKVLTDVEKDLIEVMGMCLLNEDAKVFKKKPSDPILPKKKTVILQFPTNDKNKECIPPISIKQEVVDFPSSSMDIEQDNDTNSRFSESAHDANLSPTQNNPEHSSEKEKMDQIKPEKEKPKQRRSSRKPKMITVSTNTSPIKQSSPNDRESPINIGESLMAIANALNRYCGIIERRIF